MADLKIYDSIIVGSGPAGLTAAIYNVRADLKTLVIAGNQPGGQLTITTTVENFPGFPNGIGGVKLMMDTLEQAKNLGAEVINAVVKEIKKTDKIFEVLLADGQKIFGKTVIVGTGASAKWLGLPREKELIGHGISGCATCDGMFFRNKIVAVVGGGNTALEEAIFLAKFTNKVYLIHRRDSFRADEIEQKKVFANEKIEVIWNSEVVEIIGEEKLTGIKIKNTIDSTEKSIDIDGLFVAIGRTPATDFVKDLVELKTGGQIMVGTDPHNQTMTSIPGIFAAGDCVDEIYRQAVIAAGQGAKASIEIDKWISEQN